MKLKSENNLLTLPNPRENYGTLYINLDMIIKERNISLNQLSFKSEIQRSQLRNYRDNKVQRIDIDLILRLCYVLDCRFNELVIYTPPIK